MNGDTPMDARVSVLESDRNRFEADLKEQGRRIQVLENCVQGLSRIEGILEKEVLPALKVLNECKIAEEATARLKVSWWESLWGQRLWEVIKTVAAVGITLMVAMYSHMLGVK